jgi:hypothetical protein
MPDIPRDQAEKMVLDSLSRILLDEAQLDRLVGLIADYAAKHEAERKAEAQYLREELAVVERRINNLVDFVAQGFGTKDVQERLRNEGELRDRLRARLREVEHSAGGAMFDTDYIRAYLNKCARAIEAKRDANELKEAVDAFVDTIILLPDRTAKINFRFFNAEVSTLSGSGEALRVKVLTSLEGGIEEIAI